MAERSCFSIQFSSNVFDLFHLNSYTIKLHLMISSNPSGSPEILSRDSRICGYLLPFKTLQHLRVQRCGSWPPYSPILLETIGNALSDMACDCCHWFFTLPLRCLFTSFPSSQTLVAFFFCNSGLLSPPGPAMSVQLSSKLPWKVLPVLFKALLGWIPSC